MRIAIVGTGPMGLYIFQSVIESRAPLSITLFEKGETLGVGMPYSPRTTSAAMLANIASIEIPPLTETYLAWLKRQSPEKLANHGLEHAHLDERSFTPRLCLGAYFCDQMAALIALARAKGHHISLRPRCRVTDVIPQGRTLRLTTSPPTPMGAFDKVILATGHSFEAAPPSPHYFPNPWCGLTEAAIPPAAVGIMGTSLSAIDATMVVAEQHGRFLRSHKGLRYQTSAGGKLRITLMSRRGILPEADFYCPLPYAPLRVATPEALAKAGASPTPFEALFALFRAEILDADPEWSAQIGLARQDPKGFHAAYFDARQTHDPFEWAARNLAEVEANAAARHTVPWRYAILRMHEAFETQLPALSPNERQLFEATLKKVFVDNYAAVPPESIRRILALHEAGVLKLLPLGEDYQIDHAHHPTEVRAHGATHRFDVFIDARGQRVLGIEDLPFPSLRATLTGMGQERPSLHEDCSLQGFEGQLYLAAIPFLMRDRPFVQGITACAQIARGLHIRHGASPTAPFRRSVRTSPSRRNSLRERQAAVMR